MDTFSDPQKNLKQFGLSEGMHVADFGSGSGFYTLAASEMVGDTGRVYAIDIQQELLKKVKNLSTNEHRKNIEVICGDIERKGGTKLTNDSVDVVILANIFFQFEDKETPIAEAYRVLKSKGRLLFVDWADSFGGIGPQPEYIVKEDTARELLERGGFTYERNIDAGSHHYGLFFRKT